MIYCPKCGTANRRGSHFCNECGETLPMYTGLRCPMCGSMNPVSNAYCDKCNARIVPMTTGGDDFGQSASPVRGLSLPTIPLEGQSTIAEPPESAPVEPAPAPAPQDAVREEETDWLAQLRDVTVEEGGDTAAGLLSEETAEGAEASGDWLTQLRGTAGEGEGFEPAVAAEPVEPVEIPDWLQGLGPMGTGGAISEPAPPVDTAPSAIDIPSTEMVDEVTPAPPASEPAGTSDWLQDLTSAEAEPETPGAPAFEEAALPEAAAPFDAGIDETVPSMPAPDSAGMPDWLQELAPTEGEAPGAPAFEEAALPEAAAPFGTGAEDAIPAAPAPDSAGMPDWLQELAPTEGEAPGAPAFEEAAPPEAAAPFGAGIDETVPSMPAPDSAGMPDWLQELAPTEGEAPGAPAFEEAAPPEAAAPFGAGAEDAIPAAPALDSVGIPDWLQELAPTEGEAPGAPAFEEAAPPEAVAPFDAGAEDAVPAAPALDSAGVPDWLRDLGPTEGEAPEAPAFEEAALPEAAEPFLGTPAPASADVPDWLHDLAPAGPSEAGVSFGEIEEAAPGTSVPESAGIPDWLQGMAPTGMGTDEGEAFPPEAPAIPEAAPSAEPAPIAAEIPEWLRAAAPSSSPPPFVGAQVPSIEESPEWLTGLEEGAAQPPAAPSAFGEGLPPPEGPPGGQAPEATGLARAQIPSWLEAMRPTAEAPAEAAVEEGPVETEGILEGLRGVLAPLPIAEETLADEGMLAPAVDEATLARAKLLQSLLTRATEATRPQTQARQASIMEKAPRWLIAFVLLMIVAGTLLPQQFDLGYTVPTLVQPEESASLRVYEIVETVNAGDPVVVAFEYGLSEADELDVVAESILMHLSERGADITAVSSQPEGVGIAAKMKDDIAATEQVTLTYESPQYLPGGATGIAGLLARDPKPTLIVVLAAKPAPLRWWIEQTRTTEQPAPIVAGISAMLEQVASPYMDVDAEQLKGAVIGLRDAASYEKLRDRTGSATLRLATLAIGQITIAALTLAGAGLYYLSGPRRRIV